jgi:hypothetical protein
MLRKRASKPHEHWRLCVFGQQALRSTQGRSPAKLASQAEGLIAVVTAVEPCLSYSVRGDRKTKEIHLVLETRKCLHLYHYYQHRDFGLMPVRVQTWFPFTVDVCLNGREWLAR